MKHLLLVLLSFAFYINYTSAQDLNDPGNYIGAVDNAQLNMNKTYMAYISAVAHSGRARKIEKMRQQTIQSINDCKYNLIGLPIYKGDNSLRKSSIDYVDLCYKVFNDDYAHIVNMEEIAEQSFDEMEAYILLQEKTNEKVHDATKKMSDAVDSFAAKYNVKLITTTSDLSEKMETASKLNKYYDKVYLLFFKCSWEDEQLTDAMNKKNLIKIEQSRSALISYATEGLAGLDSVHAFEGDAALSQACRQSLQFFKSNAENNVPKMMDYILKQQNFDKMKTSFEAKSDHTQEDVDAYNKSVKDINAGVGTFNQLNDNTNAKRSQAIQNWNDTVKSFEDSHMPHYKA